MKSMKPLCAALTLGACLLAAVPGYAAEDLVAGAALAARKPAAAVLQTACNATRALGLCAAAEEASAPRSLSLASLSALGSLVPAKAAPNKFLQLVKLFIDDLQVAEIGNTRVRISIEIR